MEDPSISTQRPGFNTSLICIGSIKEFAYQISLNWDDCNGTGASNERDSIIDCDICNGTGVTVVQKELHSVLCNFKIHVQTVMELVKL